MEVKIAKYLFQHTKGNYWHIEKYNDNWLIYINGSQIIKTARGKKKEYRTIESAIKDIQLITNKPVKTLTTNNAEHQGELEHV